MKKSVCVLFLFFISMSLFAFDNFLNGSWGIIMNNEKNEMVRFNSDTKEVVIMNLSFHLGDYTEADDTLHIANFDGDSVIIQYFRLSANKLLFTLWSTSNITESLTLILSKL